MPEYEAHLIKGAGRLYEAIAIECVDDEAAFDAVELLLDVSDVELWRGDTKLAKLHQYEGPSSDEAKKASNVLPFRRSFARSE